MVRVGHIHMHRMIRVPETLRVGRIRASYAANLVFDVCRVGYAIG